MQNKWKTSVVIGEHLFFFTIKKKTIIDTRKLVNNFLSKWQFYICGLSYIDKRIKINPQPN